jgi:hypothetical protein
LAAFLMTGAIAGPARAESPEEWIALGTRVHGGFGAFIPLGVRIGLDAVTRLHAKPRELAVIYHDSVTSPARALPTEWRLRPMRRSDNGP